MLLKLTIEKLQTKTAIKEHYTHITMATFFKKLTILIVCESLDDKNSHSILVEI